MTDIIEREATTPPSIETAILSRMRRAGRGSVWCVERLDGLGQRNALDQALRRLWTRGDINRIAHGVYLYPLPHPLTITTPPTIAATVAMLAESGIPVLVPTGQTAAALYDLAAPSTVHTYGTSVRTRHIVTEWWELRVSPMAMRYLDGLHPQTARVIQALRYVGQSDWGAPQHAILRAALTVHGRQTVAAQAAAAPGWMQPWLRGLASDQGASN